MLKQPDQTFPIWTSLKKFSNFKIYHQNIRGIHDKPEELLSGNLRYSKYFVLWNIIYLWLKLRVLPLITITWVPISVAYLEESVG
jgi:hypothetical protein